MQFTKFGFVIAVLAVFVISCEQTTPEAGITSRDGQGSDREGDQDTANDTIEGIYGDSAGKAAIDNGPDSELKNPAGDNVFEEVIDAEIDAGPSAQKTTDSEVCEPLDVSLEDVPVRLMLLQDRSGSMNDEVGGTPKWNLAANAVTELVTTWGNEIDIGIDFFPDPDGNQPCVVTPVVASDSLPDNTETIISSTGTEGPFTTDGGSRTPLYLAIENFLNPAHAPVFLDRHFESYLVVVSDGPDNCINQDQNPGPGPDPGPYLGPFLSPGPGSGSMEGHTPDEFASLVARVLEETGVKTVAIGFGSKADPEQLGAIAKNGGTEFATVLNAVDGEGLQHALSTIGESIQVGCTFDMGEQEEEDLNLDLVNVYLDDTPVPRDDGCAARHGWSWRDASRTAIELCEESCAVVKGGFFDRLSIKIMCAEDELSIVQGKAVDSSSL